MHDPYLYDDSTVLKNKLDIRDQDTLEGAEANYVSLRLKDIAFHPLKGDYHTPHLLKIVAEGGAVSVIRNDISIGLLSITCGALLKIATSDKGYYHKTGNTLRLNAFKEKDRRNILVSGDQMYKYIPTFHKMDIDILVASHHGGDYSETNTMMDIPNASGEGELIYSYGEVNRYGHPSHIHDYISKGWIKRYDTAMDGDYEIEIHF